MPFTFTHPAVVLPLKKIFGKWVSLTGLIIGSLTPDFEYFIRMKIQSNYSHTLLGTFWFNLPLGLLLCFVFHEIIKKPLIENSPKFIQIRTNELKKLNWTKYFKSNWIIVSLSIIIGAYSHILWDSFTHSNAYFTNYFKLDESLLFGYPLYKVFQHLSTFIGGLIILFYFKNQKTDTKNIIKPDFRYWLIFGFVTMLIFAIRLLTGLEITAYGNVIVSGITAGMIGITITSLNEKITGGNTVYKQ